MSTDDPIVEARRQWETRELPEPLAMTAATSIMRAQQAVSLEVERALRPLDLTFARYEVLMLLSFARTGALPMTKIGDRLMVHPTGITKLVDKLEERGWVERLADPDDRRVTLAAITSSGRAVAKRATEAVGSIRFGADLADPDLESLVALLAGFRR